ncbi:MAG: hypothetical protein FWD45_01570 [Coriobacteriia bacterium]|nr:hypothetical protein [Coriobacteriia bacterium]
MRAVIIRNDNSGSYVLDRDGLFRFVKGHKGTPAGTEVSLRSQASVNRIRSSALAYCLSSVVFLGSFLWLWTAPSYVVFLDINPSVQCTFNRFDRLTNISALNQDGDGLLEGLSVRGKPEDVIVELTNAAVDDGYLVSYDTIPPVSVTVVATSEEASQNHMRAIATAVRDSELDGIVSVHECSQEDLERAEELGVSPGKLDLVEQLQALDPTAEFDELINMSILDLLERIQEAEELQNNPIDIGRPIIGN